MAEPGRPAQPAAAQPQPFTAAAAQHEDHAPALNGPSHTAGGAGLPKPSEASASQAEPQPAAAHGDTVGDSVRVNSETHAPEGSSVQPPAGATAGEAASRSAAQAPAIASPIADTAQAPEEPVAADVAQRAADGASCIASHDQVMEQRSGDGGDVQAEALTSAVAEALALARDDRHVASDGANAPAAVLAGPQRPAALAGLPNGDVTADADEASDPPAEPAADAAEQPLPADGADAAEPAAPDAAEEVTAGSPAKPPLPQPDSSRALQQEKDQQMQDSAADGPRSGEGQQKSDRLHMVGSIPDMSAAWKAKVAVSDATQVRWVRVRVRV